MCSSGSHGRCSSGSTREYRDNKKAATWRLFSMCVQRRRIHRKGKNLHVGRKPQGIGCVGRTWWPPIVYKVKKAGAIPTHQHPTARQRSEACDKSRTHPGQRRFHHPPAHQRSVVRGKSRTRLGNLALTGRPNPTSKPRATSRVNPSAAAKRNCGRRWCN